ncbi:MAG: D-Ala-D-Ala carboxypeptidase family metallohydrolase [Candidatus Marinamargulisbacteria bacterium]
MSETQEKQNKPNSNQQKSRNRRRRRRPDNRNKQPKNNTEHQKDGSNQRGQQQRSNQNNRNNNQNRNRQQRNKKSQGKWNRHRISEHFMKRDFDSRKKDCDCDSSLRISLGLVGIIEALRAKLNKRIDIVTGYYCPDCRERQYGIKRDFHHQGVAADIRVEGMDSVSLFLEAESFPEIKGLGINLDNDHVHIDTRKEDERTCWVETNNEWIQLTDENRSEYITAPAEPSQNNDDLTPDQDV